MLILYFLYTSDALTDASAVVNDKVNILYKFFDNLDLK